MKQRITIHACARLFWSAVSLGLTLAAGVAWGQPPPEKTGAQLENGCAAGHAEDCGSLGFRLIFGEGGVQQDLVRSAQVLKKSCDAGYARACHNLGTSYHLGLGVPKDEAKAIAMWDKACQAGEGAGCAKLGLAYLNGSGVPKDPARTLQLYGQACDGGEMSSCNDLGLMLDSGTDVPPDTPRAFKLFEKSCAGGPRFCNNLGHMYSVGKGTAVDLSRGAELYEKACAAGEALGCSNLGGAYLNGNGVKQDLARARSLFETACKANIAAGCNNLGVIFANGMGVAQDQAKASTYFRQACHGEFAPACDTVKKRSTLLAGPAQDQAGRTVSFTIEGEKYSMALPEGFCLPTDPKVQTAASRMAQADSANITHFTAVPCTEVFPTDGVLSAWIVLKTPRGTLSMRIPARAAMLAEYKKGFDGDLQRLLDQPGISDATERLQQVFGAAVRLNKFDMKPVDLDDNAAYMGGALDMVFSGTPVRMAAMAGLTRVKKHLFNYYRYEKVGNTGTVVESLARMLPLTKAEVRAFIKDNPE